MHAPTTGTHLRSTQKRSQVVFTFEVGWKSLLFKFVRILGFGLRFAVQRLSFLVLA